MGKLTQVTLLRILHTMIQDEEFLKSLLDCMKQIFDIPPQNPGTNDSFEIVVDRIIQYFEIHPEIQKVEIPGIRSTLIGMFKEKQFLAFARVLRMLKDLNYTDARIIDYLKQLKFRTEMDGESISPWIDFQSTAEAVIRELNPGRMRIFAGLSREERCLLRGFTSEEIAVMSKFSPRGIVVLSKLGHLPPNQRSMILGLDQNERRLFHELVLDEISLLSTEEGQKTLQKLIDREGVVVRSMSKEAGTLAGTMNDLAVGDIGKYSNLSPEEVNVLNNLNDDHREVVSRFRNLEVILNIAKNLHSSQRNFILSLRREDIHASLGIEYGDLEQIQRMHRYSPKIIQQSYSLPVGEEHAILTLNEQQRSVLARAYALGHDGLFMIHNLGPELTNQVFSGKEDLTVMQTALKNKLVNVNFDKTILSELFEIMKHKSQTILLDLSWKGVQLLRKTSDLDQEMIEIVRRLSNNGMEVLLNNDQLTAGEISILGRLDTNEGNVLMNLDVKQRNYLSDRPDLTEAPPGLFNPKELTKLSDLSNTAELVLKRIIVLTGEEQRLLRGLEGMNTAVLNSILPEGLNLLASLTSENLNLLTTFMFWRLGEDLIFKFFRIPLGTPYEEKIRETRRIIGSVPGTASLMDQHDHIPLIAGATEILRLNGVVTDGFVQEMIPMFESPTLSLIFKVALIKFSFRDSTGLRSQLTSQIQGTEEDILRVGQFNEIRTIEDLMFIRWILSSSSTTNNEGLFGVGRGSLIYLSHHLGDGHKLEALISVSTSQLDGIEHKTLMENFKLMLRADQHLLSSFLFFTIGRRTTSREASNQVTKFFTDNFDADESFEFLKSLAYVGFLNGARDDGLPGIRSDGRFPNPTIFEVCLYHNRGSILALAEKLDERQLWNLLENRPLLVLRMMTRNVQIDLIELFGNVAEVKQVWKERRVEIAQSLIGELTQHPDDFAPEMYLHLARGIRRLMYWPSFLGTETYITVITEYTQLVRGRVSSRILGNILDSFVSEDVSREYLEQRLIIPQRDRVRTSCNVLRKKRAVRVLCLDSETTADIPSKAKQRIIQSAYDDSQSTLYDELLEYSERKFRGEDLDSQVRRDLMARIKDVPVDSLDPRIGDIVPTLDTPRKFDAILKQSGMLNKIQKVAGTTGSIFTMFFVGKHIAHGDVQGLGYDALNLFVLPKIGEKITEAMEKSNPVTGSVIGTTVSNFAAYLGLVDGIIDRKDAVREVDKEMADLNIISNAVFIAADIPAVATQILLKFGVESVVLGEFGGPVGVALTVPVVIGSYFIGLGLEVEKVSNHTQLSLWEEFSVYWGFFLDQPLPDKFVIDMLAKDMYTEYIVNHLHRLNGSYDQIALSLPSLLITERNGIASVEMDFNHRVKALYPFSRKHQHSRIVPENIQGYDFVCGPSTRDAMEKINPHTHLKELFIPSKPDDECQNIASFRKRESANSSKTFFYVASNASIGLSNTDSLDIVFHGRNISITADGISVNRFYFQHQPDGCRIQMGGQNFFYVVGESFECDLGEQHNTVVVRGDFRDSSGIHSIIGSEGREKITANFAEFVDGSGGGDFIRATRNTIVKGYVNDFLTGDCTVMLPFNISGIAKLVAHTRMTISNHIGSWIEVDGNARIMTADYYLLTPIRTSNITHRMTRAHIRKIFKHQISIGRELPVLRNLTIPECKLVKQITSANCDIVLSDLGQNVFTLDKNAHEYFWEASKVPGNLYIFRKLFVKVTISNANGILDFKDLRIDPTFDGIDQHWSPEGGFEISIGGLHVILLPEYGNVRITFDGKKYFKLGRSELSRDWCSHSLPIVGRVFIDGTDLDDHYNCFEFQSDKISFLRLRTDLVLVSRKQVLTVTKYYSHLHGGTELSMKLKDGRIVEAPEFGKRADQAHKVIYYEVGNSELRVYHNQPVDKHLIGYLDLVHRSIKDVDMRIDDGGLILLYGNSTLVRIENWDHYEPARDMVFVFNDSFLPNAECIFSDCDPNDIIEELEIEKRKRSATSSASRSSSWINFIVHPIRTLFLPGTGSNRTINDFDTDFCITSNVNLVFLLLRNFLDGLSPLPTLPTITTVERLANVIDFIEEYQGNNDSFQLYSEIVELVRNQRYDAIQTLIH